MINSFFGGRKSLVDRLASSQWKDPAEHDALCAELGATAKAGEVMSLLSHADSGVRAAAAEAFLRTVDARAFTTLIELAAQNAPLRTGLMRIAARCPDSVQIAVVEDLIEDKSAARQRLGWDVGVTLTGPQRVPMLERALRDAPIGVRRIAAQRIVTERKVADQLELLMGLTRDPDAQIAQTALEAIAAADYDLRILPVMLDVFASPDPVLRQKATQWLARAAARDPIPVRKRMLEVLGSGEDSVRAHCVQVLLSTGRPAEVVEALLVHSATLAGWLRTRIIESLKGAGDPVVAAAISLLGHPDEGVRTAALALCEHLHDRRVVAPVARLLTDPDWWMRISACDTLGRLGDEHAVPALVSALEDPDTRWAAIDALAQIGSTDAIRPLAKLMTDDRLEVRLEVIRALSRFSEPRLVPLFQQVKDRDPSSEVRTRAAEVLRDIQARAGQASSKEEGTATVASAQLKRPIDKLLAMIREKGASDLHLTVGEPPWIRQNGEIARMEEMGPVSAEQTRASILSLLDDRQRAILERAGELDFCHAVPEVGRYRANCFVQRKGMCAAFRVIPNVPPTFGELRIPPQLAELLDYHQGMILVAGPAGSGKSTTLAAIVNLINETKADHVITLEDPIEFTHPVKTALVNQREVGRHTASFARALRAALREDPDVIVVGEMRDTETMRLALTAAETGHLVIATLNTTGAVASVERIVKAFPPDEQPQVRIALSESLKFVLSQQLLPRKDGKGRVAAFEVMKGTLSVGNLIRDNKSFQIGSMMQIGRTVGMQTRDMAVSDLVEAGLVDERWLAPQAATFVETGAP